MRENIKAAQGRLPLSLFALLILSMITGIACSSQKGSGGKVSGITVKGEFSNCYADSVKIFSITGQEAKQVASTVLTKGEGASTFEFSLKELAPGFYLLGSEPRFAGGVILGEESEVSVTADCQNLAQTLQVNGSAINDNYKSIMENISKHQNNANMLVQNIRAFQASDPAQVPKFQEQLAASNAKHFAWLDSLSGVEGFIGKVAKVYNYKPFGMEESHSAFSDEFDYFKSEFFAGMDLKDGVYSRMPQLHDKSQYYAASMAQRGVKKEEIVERLDAVLGKTESGSRNHQIILLGFTNGLEQAKSDAFIDFGKKFVAAYPDEQQMAATINQKITAISRLASGAEAPELTLQTPEGETMNLTDLRGKYVLIDFWASWCRPCRMENPNVVKAYQKYHPKGFEIFGVSLDNNKDKWVAAIAKDGLKWPHVSDLQGWRSVAASTYSVNSIPATFLLDKEGKIMARNLRGGALEEKLKEIFGF